MSHPHPWPGFRQYMDTQGSYIEEVYRRVVNTLRPAHTESADNDDPPATD